MRDGTWEEFKERYWEEKKSSEWTLERIREGYDKVAKMKLDAWVLSRQIRGRALTSYGGSSR